jgi:class II lanthipeptide synthase
VEADVLEYAEAIAAGFMKIYRTLLRYRDELLGEDGPLARFAEDEVRVILCSTRTCGLLLIESFHPDVLRDALDRDHSFDRLWAGVGQIPELARIIPAEREDLWRNDVPIFTTRPDSRDLCSSSGERIAEFFEVPDLALVRRRVQQLSDEDLTKQLWLAAARAVGDRLGALALQGEGDPTRGCSRMASRLLTRLAVRALCRWSNSVVRLQAWP